MAETKARIVQVVRGSHGSMRLYSNGVVHFAADQALHIDQAVVLRTDTEFRQLADGPYVSVLDFRSASYADREARDYAALMTDDTALATAVIFGGEVGGWLLNRWMEESGPQRPVAFFTEEPAAMAWASERASELLGTP